jgi:hypothetical protein
MTRRWIETANFRFVTVDAHERPVLIDCRQLLAHVLTQSVFVVTLGARRDGYIRFQTAQRRGFGDVDVTRGALENVVRFLASAFVYELCGDAGWRGSGGVRRSYFMTALTVSSDGWLRFPVTVETRSVVRG